MNDQFDSPRCRAVAAGELAKGLAKSVTRRGALKKFGLGLVGAALALVGLPNKARAGGEHNRCVNRCKQDCAQIHKRNTLAWEYCWTDCAAGCPDGGV